MVMGCCAEAGCEARARPKVAMDKATERPTKRVRFRIIVLPPPRAQYKARERKSSAGRPKDCFVHERFCVRYREIGASGIKLSVLGLGGHEYLPDGRLRGFQEDFPRAITPGHLFPDFGQEQRRRVVKLAYDLGINFYDVTQDSEKEALGRNLREMPPPFDVYVQTRPEGMMYDRDPGNRKMAEYASLKSEVE